MKKILLTLTAGAFLSAAVAQDITSNLVAHVSFDNGDATIDAGTATIPGVITGATSVADRFGNPNSAMSFDGTDYINFGNNSNYQFGYDSFTIACWMKADATSGGAGYVIGKRGFTNGSDQVYALTYNYNNGGEVFGYLRDDFSLGTVYPTASAAADEWHHVAFVVDRIQNYAGFYVDGAPVSAEQLNLGFEEINANGSTFGDLVFGRASNGDQYFRGIIDEAYIFRRALSQADVITLAGPLPVDLTSDLQIHYPFCDGLVTDVSPSNYTTGTVSTSAGTDRNGVSDGAQVFNPGLIQLPGDLISNTDFTIAVWYYYTGVGQYPRLMDLSKQNNSTSDAIILYPSNTGNSVPFFGMWNSASQQVVSLQASEVLLNQWVHIAVTKVGTVYTMYLNGEYEIATSVPWSPSNVARPVSQLGRSAYTNSPEWFPGSIDDFRVWQRGLNNQEVAALYNETDACTPVAPCDVNIPDVALKAALVGNASINTNLDGEIQCSEAAAFTGFLGLSNLGISDLTGLEAFTAATQLDISGNNLTSFDISANTALTTFDCSVLGLTGTVTFDAANSALLNVFVDGNQLTGVDVSALSNLRHLDFGFNGLTSIDLSSNAQLRILVADFNDLTALDLSNNPLLTDISCTQNDIVSLDFSQNPLLVTMNAQINPSLVYLNVANGNNTNFTYYSSIATPNLSCVQVDDVVYSTNNWPNVDAANTFNTFCTPPITVGVEEQESATLSIYPNPTESELFFSEAIAGEVLDLSGKSLIQFPMTRTLDLSQLADGVYLIRTASGTVNRIVKN